MASHKIVPFQCEECGVKFAEPRGGVCAGCGRVLCSRHLVVHWGQDKPPSDVPGPLCGACRGEKLQQDEKR